MRRRLLLGLLWALPAWAAAQTVERITWLVGDTLAVRVSGSVDRPSDRMIRWLSERLPDLQHQRLPANAKRSWMLIGQGEDVCHAGAVRLPEREQLAYFSNTWLLPPLQLVVRSEHRAKLPLDAAGQVDLVALMASPSQHGVLVHGRSYGPALDAMLARRPVGTRLNEVSSGDFGSNLVPMLLQGRADYAIEYPNALTALIHSRLEVQGLVTVPIKGAIDPVVCGVACPRTPWGLAAIA